MNRPIVRLYGLVVVLFAVLIAFTSRWTVFEASSLRTSELNVRGLLQQERIDRGPILAANGAVLAHSVRGAEGAYSRSYPRGSEFTAPVGYSFIERGQVGLELYRNAALDGETGTSVQSILDQLQGRKPQGNTVVTTLQPSAQQTAIAALGEHEGAVVALDPRTGAVEVMASTPSYDANAAASRASYERVTRESGAPLLNRAVQYGYAPGSTFKVVTATAAIEPGGSPLSTVSGRNEFDLLACPCKTTTARFWVNRAARSAGRPSTPCMRRSPRVSASPRWRATCAASASTASPSSITPRKKCRPAASTCTAG